MTYLDLNPTSELNKKGKTLCLLGWRLALAGAETRLIYICLQKVGKALQVENPEYTVTRSMVTVKIYDNHSRFCVHVNKIQHLGINMNSVSRINKIVNEVVSNQLTDVDEIYNRVREVRPTHYNNNMLALIEAFAGAAFAYCNGGSLYVCLTCFYWRLYFNAL